MMMYFLQKLNIRCFDVELKVCVSSDPLIPPLFFFFTAIAVFKRILLTTSSPHFSAGRIERTKREHT